MACGNDLYSQCHYIILIPTRNMKWQTNYNILFMFDFIAGFALASKYWGEGIALVDLNFCILNLLLLFFRTVLGLNSSSWIKSAGELDCLWSGSTNAVFSIKASCWVTIWGRFRIYRFTLTHSSMHLRFSNCLYLVRLSVFFDFFYRIALSSLISCHSFPDIVIKPFVT